MFGFGKGRPSLGETFEQVKADAIHAHNHLERESLEAELKAKEQELLDYENGLPVYGAPQEGSPGYVPGDKEAYAAMLRNQIKGLRQELGQGGPDETPETIQ